MANENFIFWAMVSMSTPSFFALAEVFHAGREREGEFLHGVAAGVVIDHHIHGNGRGGGDFLQFFFKRLVEHAANPFADRLEAGDRGVVAVHFAEDLPVVVGFDAANVGGFAGLGAEVRQVLQVFLAVDGLDFDAFQGLGDQFFLEGRAFEGGHGGFLPVLVGRNGELV
ncbi:MAG: hypothetical protein PHQ12_04365 [Chthoniobacteraceae bacterium]|nr:hypothetical protein [Chthoniobacteraceae bacterium]